MWEAMKECKRALKWMKKNICLMERAGHLWRFYLWFPFFHFMYVVHILSDPAASQPSDLWPPLHPQHVGGSAAVSDRTRVPFLTCTSERESKAKTRCLSGTGQKNRKKLKCNLKRPNSGPKSKRNENRLLDAPDRWNLAKFHTPPHIHAGTMGGFASGEVSLH